MGSPLVEYARISNPDQSPELQLDTLKERGIGFRSLAEVIDVKPHDIRGALALRHDPEVSVRSAAKRLRVGVPSLYRHAPRLRARLGELA